MADRIIQTSLAAGEFSELARDRSDLDAYAQGADILQNVVALVEGAARRRMGTRFVAEAKASGEAMFFDFSKSNEDTVLIEAGDNYLRYFDGDTMAPQMNGGAPLETATPWTAAQAARRYWAQSADVMFFTDLDAAGAPYALRRFAGDAWSLVAYGVKFGPFLTRQSGGISITPSNVVGPAVTLNASGALFDAGHVGARFRLYEPNLGVPYDKWLPKTAVLANELREYAGNVYQSLNQDQTSDQPPVHEAGTVRDRNPTGSGVVNWTYLHDLSGSGVITAVASPTQATMSVEERLPSTAATGNWAEGAFSNFRGWPRLVGVYDQRLFFASTRTQPDTIFLSRTEGFNESDVDFKQSKGNDAVEDDHAIVRTLSDNEVNAPAFAVVVEQLILGTARGLLRVIGPSIDEPLTPVGASARRIPNTRPAGKHARPVIAGDALLYGSQDGSQIFEFAPEAAPRAINARARHVGAAPIVQFVWCGEPHQRLYARDADGQLWICAYDRSEGVIAWSRWTPAGNFEGGPPKVDRIAAIRDGQGRARLVLLVRRTIGGVTKRYIERHEPDWTATHNLPEAANMMDAAIAFNHWNASATTVTVIAAAGADAGAIATLSASAGTPFAGKIGAVFSVRRRHAPAKANDAPGEMRMLITAISGGGGATATLLSSSDEASALLNTPLLHWGFPQNVIGGLAHLEGETVAVMADGFDAGRYSVAGGQITLDEAVMSGFAGLETRWAARSLPLARQIEDGASRGKPKAIESATVSLFETGAEAAMSRLIEDGVTREGWPLGGRSGEDFMGVAPPIRSFIETIDGLADFGGEQVQLEIYGAGVFPATIKSIAVTYANET